MSRPSLQPTAPAVPGYELLKQLPKDKFDALFRLMIWMKNTNPTDQQLRVKFAQTLNGDQEFAAVVLALLEASRSPRMHAANDHGEADN